MTTLLSIIIPIYNSEKYIEKCLKSICDQNNSDWEILMIDDGSIDSSPRICKKYAELHSNFQLISKENGGVSSARNRGLDIAKGKFIFFLDSDDTVTNEFKWCIEQCTKKKYPYTFFKREFLHRNRLEYDFSHLKSEWEYLGDDTYYISDPSKVMRHKFFCSGSGEVLVRKDIIGKTRFDTKRSILEDFDFFFNILNRLDGIYFIDKCITIINDFVPNSLTRKKIKLSNKEYLAESNNYLQNHNNIKKRVYWIENYFDIKRLIGIYRVRHFIKMVSKHYKYIQVNKYFLGYLFFLLGIDINKVRQSFVKRKNV